MVYRTFLYNPTNLKVPKKAPCRLNTHSVLKPVVPSHICGLHVRSGKFTRAKCLRKRGGGSDRHSSAHLRLRIVGIRLLTGYLWLDKWTAKAPEEKGPSQRKNRKSSPSSVGETEQPSINPNTNQISICGTVIN